MVKHRILALASVFLTGAAQAQSDAVVPHEPETWAMLLAGIGLLGWMLYRCRS
jgi:hypothetical protein